MHIHYYECKLHIEQVQFRRLNVPGSFESSVSQKTIVLLLPHPQYYLYKYNYDSSIFLPKKKDICLNTMSI